MSEVTVRVATLADEAGITALSRLFDETKSMAYNWRRWGCWGDNSLNKPLIALIDDAIVGFQGTLYQLPSGYINSQFTGVKPGHQGMGIGGKLIDAMFAIGHDHGLSRIKIKTPPGRMGEAFWRGFGMQPFAQDDHYLIWDEDISQVCDVASLIQWMKHRDIHKPVPANTVARLVSKGARLL